VSMKNMKVSMKLTTSFLIVITLTIFVGAVGIVGMMRINRGSREMFESQSQPLADLGMAREYFQRLRVQLRDVVLASGNNAELDMIEADLVNHERGFITFMEAYRRTITDPDMIELYGEIMAAFGEYQPSMQQIMESARVNAPPVQMIIMMNALSEPTDFVMEALYYLAYIRVLEATHVNDVNSYLSNVLLVVIIAVIAVSIAVALFLAKYISGLIGRPLAEIGLFANRVSIGEINMANVSRNSIDVGSSDEIGALARILEQSYAQLSEYERSWRRLRRSFDTVLLPAGSAWHRDRVHHRAGPYLRRVRRWRRLLAGWKRRHNRDCRKTLASGGDHRARSGLRPRLANRRASVGKIRRRGRAAPGARGLGVVPFGNRPRIRRPTAGDAGMGRDYPGDAEPVGDYRSIGTEIDFRWKVPRHPGRRCARPVHGINARDVRIASRGEGYPLG